MKNYRVISKVILTICLCGIVLAVINGFTGIINNSIQISGTIICISAFVVASVTIILLENGRIKNVRLQKDWHIVISVKKIARKGY